MAAFLLPGHTTAWRTPCATSKLVKILTFSLLLYISPYFSGYFYVFRFLKTLCLLAL
ncbi:Uncharacterised protein [Segatella copri]|nr:Uncharacterised protein [Segatella copri]